MLYLNAEHIRALADPARLVTVIEEALACYAAGDITMPNRFSVTHRQDTYLYMPCFTSALGGTKFLSLVPGNPALGKPVISGLMILNNPATGEIDCILDGAAVTAWRTGAVGATGVKHTVPASCARLGIIGAGVQSYYQCISVAAVQDIGQICIYDQVPGKAEDLGRRLEEALPGMRIRPCKTPEELLVHTELVITATPSPTPVLPDNGELLRGKHYIGIGSYKPTMREYPDALFRLVDEVYIDVEFAKEESGDLCVPLAKGLLEHRRIKTLAAALQEGIAPAQTTLFKTVGMALFDLMVANHLRELALESGLGVQLEP